MPSIVFLSLRVERMRLLEPIGDPVDRLIGELPLVPLVAPVQASSAAC